MQTEKENNINEGGSGLVKKIVVGIVTVIVITAVFVVWGLQTTPAPEDQSLTRVQGILQSVDNSNKTFTVLDTRIERDGGIVNRIQKDYTVKWDSDTEVWLDSSLNEKINKERPQFNISSSNVEDILENFSQANTTLRVKISTSSDFAVEDIILLDTSIEEL